MRRGPPNLASTARRFAFRIVHKRHPAPTINADGLPVTGSPVVSTPLAHCYPVTGKDIERLPDGVEARHSIMGSIEHDLELGDEETGQRADTILVFGSEFEIVQISDFASGPRGSTTWREFTATKVRR